MLDDIRLWNSSTGSWSRLGYSSPSYRHYGTSVLLPLRNSTTEKGKILIVGGSPTSADPATTRVQILDFNSGNPEVRTVASLRYGRKYPAPVILPDGKVGIFGGVSQGTQVNYRYVPEMFDPNEETWTSLSSASVPRTYHQVAFLLSDGRVWNAGSTATRSNWELRVQYFRPSYYSTSRPSISSAPTIGAYGGDIVIPTSNGSSITTATLVKLPDTTHHYDANMRMLTLPRRSYNSTSVTVQAPLNSRLAPPGYYYLHILNSSGIPSRARIVRIR
jgi:galactose oxidase